MSLLEEEAAPGAAPPSSRPTTDARSLLRRARLPLVLLGLLVLGALLIALLTPTTNRLELDPDGATQDGSRAVARLLAARGIGVRRVPSVGGLDALDATTVLAPSSGRLGAGDLTALAGLASRTDVVVVVDASGDLQRLGAGAGAGDTSPGRGQGTEHDPGCSLPAAVAAGRAATGTTPFVLDAVGPLRVTDRCYASGRGDGAGPTLVRLTAPGAPGSLVLLRSADLLRNRHLAEQGNAALALGLLDHGRPVSWVLPLPGEATDTSGRPTSLGDLLPRRLLLAALELLIVALLLGLWRGRRLGPVVVEPLPVVVRSVETVQGRARLYRGAKARDRAALALREAARARAARALGLGPQTVPRVLVDTVAAQVGRPGEEVAGLLYGRDRAASPADDAALVTLADGLDALVDALGSGATRGGSRRTIDGRAT